MNQAKDEVESGGPQFISLVQDSSIGLLGYVVVDSTINGHACGGLRLSNDITVDNLKRLARGMTLKYGFSGMAQGGAKAGIVGDPESPPEHKKQVLRRFGEIISPLLRSGFYISGPDMGIGVDDIDEMLSGAGIKIHSQRRYRGKNSGYFTALGVMVAAKACASFRRLDLSECSIAIEGFGSVGSSLAWLMARKTGAKVVAVSTSKGAIYNPHGLDIETLLRLREEIGCSLVKEYRNAERIKNEELFLLDVDILFPCATQYSITMDNVQDIRSSIICPGANNPVTYEAERALFERGILSIPCFIANCGGVLGNKIEKLGVSNIFIESFIRKKNEDRIKELIEKSQAARKPMILIAERYAMNRFWKMQDAAYKRNLKTSLYKTALRVLNTGFVPEWTVRPWASLYLDRAMGKDPPISA